MRPFQFLIITILCSKTIFALPPENCGPNPNQIIEEVGLKLDHLNPRIKAFAQGNLRKLWKRSSNIIFKDLYTSISSPQSKMTREYFRSDKFVIDIEIRQVAEKLQIKIFNIKSGDLRLGKRPKELHMDFGYLISSIIDATLERVKQDSSIKIVKIMGDTVINEGLIQMFKEFGFYNLSSRNDWILDLDVIRPPEQLVK